MMKKTSQIQTNLGALQSISLILFSTRKTLGRYMYKLYIVYGDVRGEPASIRGGVRSRARMRPSEAAKAMLGRDLFGGDRLYVTTTRDATDL